MHEQKTENLIVYINGVRVQTALVHHLGIRRAKTMVDGDKVTWHGVTDIYGNYVWKYQDTVYYTARDRSQNYQLNTKRY